MTVKMIVTLTLTVTVTVTVTVIVKIRVAVTVAYLQSKYECEYFVVEIINTINDQSADNYVFKFFKFKAHLLFILLLNKVSSGASF